MTQAGKVAEIFSVAGEAFTKLGSLAMALQTPSERMQDGSKWADDEIEMLRKAITQFGTDIEKISDQIRTKSANQIKSALKQKAIQNLTIAPTGKNTPGSVIISQLNKTPVKIQNVPRSIGEKSKASSLVMVKGGSLLVGSKQPVTKKLKLETPNMNLLTSTPQQKTVIRPSSTGIPVVASSQGFQMLIAQQVTPQAKNISMPAMHSGIVQHVSDANTSGNVDVES